MDDFTLSVAKQWIKQRKEGPKEDCACGTPELFDAKLETVAEMW